METVYTSDFETINALIEVGKCDPTDIKILSSLKLLHWKILKKFPMIENILTPLLVTFDEFNNMCDLLINLPNLKEFVVLIMCDDNEYDWDNLSDDLEPPKKRTKTTDNANTIGKKKIPSLFQKFGNRLSDMILTISIINIGDSSITSINLNKGILHIDGKNISYHNNILRQVYKSQSLNGLIIDPYLEYKLKNIKDIPYLKIKAQIDINESYIAKLIKRTKNITVLYNSDTFSKRSSYSTLISNHTNGNLRTIKSIIPVSDVDLHINSNTHLQEIDILINNSDDVDILIPILQKYKLRDIIYNIYYYQTSNNKYWLPLSSYADISYHNIILYLFQSY